MARVPSGRKPKDFKYTLKRFFYYLGTEKRSFLLIIPAIFLSVGANIAGTYMIKPVVNSIMDPGATIPFSFLVLLTALIYAFGVLAALTYTQMMARSGNRIIYRMRKDLFSHLETLPMSFFDKKRHGETMSLFTNDADTVSDAISNSLAPVIKNSFQITGTFFVMLLLNWRLTLITIAFYVVMTSYLKFSGKRSKKYFSLQQKTMAELNGYIEEMISGIKVVKVFNHEKEMKRELEEKVEALRRSGTSAQSYASTMIPSVVSLGFLNYALVAIVGGIMVIRGSMDVGSLASYLVFVRQSSAPINQFTQQSNFLISSLAGAERIFHTLEERSEEDEGKVTLEENTEGRFWVKEDGGRIPLRGDVRFNDVEFSYDSRKKVLDRISLYAKPGQKIAFVGSTGAGKTTITNLLGRFYEHGRGTITYDGIDIRDISKDALRSSFRMVLQDTHLFTATIRENIRYGYLSATDEEVEEAARRANADSFIRRLPEGYDTMIRNDGDNLSSGQRQLIAIARAAVSSPSVLILDEATSNVDTMTEDKIEKAMDSLMEGRTTLVIAHRLSTVRNSQAIMVLENGRIIERGSHEDLLKEKGTYYQLYKGVFELE